MKCHHTWSDPLFSKFLGYHKPPTEHDLKTQVILRDTQIGAEPSLLSIPISPVTPIQAPFLSHALTGSCAFPLISV